MEPDAKRPRVLKRVASGDAALMQQASSRCCPAEAICNGVLLRCLADENVAGFENLDLGSSSSQAYGQALAFGPVESRQDAELELTWGSCCSGSEGPAYAVAAINDVCRARGLRLKFKHSFSCESTEEKRTWIAQVLGGLGADFEGAVFSRISQQCGRVRLSAHSMIGNVRSQE